MLFSDGHALRIRGHFLEVNHLRQPRPQMLLHPQALATVFETRTFRFWGAFKRKGGWLDGDGSKFQVHK